VRAEATENKGISSAHIDILQEEVDTHIEGL
jgi:hypothetical protein